MRSTSALASRPRAPSARSSRPSVASLASHLAEPELALEAFRTVLAQGHHAAAGRALLRLAMEHEALRGDALAVLEPVLRAAGAHEDLVELLDLRARTAEEAEERVAALADMAHVLEGALSSPQRAFEALLRALPEANVDDKVFAKALQVAVAVGRDAVARYADALEARAQATVDGVLASSLNLRLGRVAAGELGDDGRERPRFSARPRGEETPPRSCARPPRRRRGRARRARATDPHRGGARCARRAALPPRRADPNRAR